MYAMRMILPVAVLLLLQPAYLRARIATRQADNLIDLTETIAGSGDNLQEAISDVDSNGDNDKQIKEFISTDDYNDSYTDVQPMRLDNPKYFEGDIIISEKEIIEAYGPHTSTQVRAKRGAINNRKWPYGIVYYDFHSSVNLNLRNKILNAISVYERETCLDFRSPNGGDCIQFTAEGDGCTSYIGKQGGIQKITLPDFGSKTCQTHGIILHEIGHAIGFWHEQSRPDRDRYVTINWGNIEHGVSHAFDMRHNVDYHDEIYDYRSIMHYHQRAFSKNGYNTISVNAAQHRAQGQPPIGQQYDLSPSDITQINRMYYCPSTAYRGNLKVKMLRATDLPDTDGWLNRPDPYACIEAVTINNQRYKKCTRHKSGTCNPTWNQELNFRGSTVGWRYFEISIWDDDWGGDDRMISTQTIWVTPGSQYNKRFCNSRTQCVYFNYHMTVDGNECSPNPCRRGTCRDLFVNYLCTCPSNYSGKNCEYSLVSLYTVQSGHFGGVSRNHGTNRGGGRGSTNQGIESRGGMVKK